jgi:hypothetical protein
MGVKCCDWHLKKWWNFASWWKKILKWQYVTTNFFFSLWKESPKFWEKNSLFKTCFILKLICYHIISMSTILKILGKHVANRIIHKVRKIQHKNHEFGHKQGNITKKTILILIQQSRFKMVIYTIYTSYVHIIWNHYLMPRDPYFWFHATSIKKLNGKKTQCPFHTHVIISFQGGFF